MKKTRGDLEQVKGSEKKGKTDSESWRGSREREMTQAVVALAKSGEATHPPIP